MLSVLYFYQRPIGERSTPHHASPDCNFCSHDLLLNCGEIGLSFGEILSTPELLPGKGPLGVGARKISCLSGWTSAPASHLFVIQVDRSPKHLAYQSRCLFHFSVRTDSFPAVVCLHPPAAGLRPDLVSRGHARDGHHAIAGAQRRSALPASRNFCYFADSAPTSRRWLSRVFCLYEGARCCGLVRLCGKGLEGCLGLENTYSKPNDLSFAAVNGATRSRAPRRLPSISLQAPFDLDAVSKLLLGCRAIAVGQIVIGGRSVVGIVF
ncbi:hypothetical protein KC357_g288 [Hortaea werneckii]|nr:hypothetical protein KC357_g288 [Hortaea werneckii]